MSIQNWKDDFSLREGEVLINETHKLKGSLQQTDAYYADIADIDQNIVGYITVEDHTEIKAPFNRSVHIKITYKDKGTIFEKFI